MRILLFPDADVESGGGEGGEGARPSGAKAEALLDGEPGQAAKEGEAQELPTADEGVGADVKDSLALVLPWMTSLLFHLGIVLITMFVVWYVVPALDEEKGPIIPIARLSDTPGGGSLSQSSSSDTGLQTTQAVRNIQTESVSTGESLQSLNTNVGGGEALQLIGVSGGAGGADAGRLGQFGTTQGQGQGLNVGFYGTGGNARKIIYVVDASGSLIDTLPFVIKELKESISSLKEQQQYTVVFFQAGDPVEVPPVGWKAATADNKRKTFEFIDLDAGNIVPRGRTDPVKAIKLSMKYKPELMFILSDNITGKGQYEVDRDELLKFLNDVNKDRKTTINTIQFLYPDPLETLKTIATEHRGTMKFVTEADLGLSKQ